MASASVIVGSASGIGLALATALARREWRVVLADIEADKAKARAAELRAQGYDAVGHPADAVDAASLERLADFAFARFGTVNLLVNNAGVGAAGPLHKVKPEMWRWTFAVNVDGLYHAARAFIPRMLAQGAPARIVNTASEHALGLPPRGGQITAYTGTKHAVLGLSEGMRRDYAGTNVAVSVVCPGLVATQVWNALRNRHPQFGGPREAPPEAAAGMSNGITPETAAARILDGIEAGEFLILTHGRDIAEVTGPRIAEVEAALARFKARYGGGA
jgi:NAD(P)-dependent dehydrogenase (short-subunit alcohol dehydrogenase family)